MPLAREDVNKLTFNQFQKQLRDRGIDPQIAYMLSVCYEQILDMAQQTDQMATALVGFADVLQGFVQLRAMDAEAIEQLRRRNLSDGVEVSSSIIDDPSKKN